MHELQTPSGVVTLSNGDLTVHLAEFGAELVRLRDGAGRDYLWTGDPEFWKGRAPLLFPMVGGATGDRIRVGGATYPLPQHGFARVSKFECVDKTPTRCLMQLRSNDVTRASYPFEFRLDVACELQEQSLLFTAIIQNEGDVALPCSFGFHPAFRWPLPGANRDDPHEIMFDRTEREPVRRLIDGLLDASTFPNPVEDRRLVLQGKLFDDGAMIFDRIASRSVIYAATSGPSIEVSFADMPNFGLWTKPGAPFICIEPWHGFASPEGYDGEFAARPGVISIPPRDARQFQMRIGVRPAS